MPEASPPTRKRPLNSLSVKSLGIVLAATLFTALALGGVSVHSTYSLLSARLDRAQPTRLEATSARLVEWLERGSGTFDGLAADPRPERLEAALEASAFFEALTLREPDGEVRFEAGTANALPASGDPPASPDGAPVVWVADADFQGPPVLVSVRLAGSATLHGSFRRDALLDLLARGEAAESRVCVTDAAGRLRRGLCSQGPHDGSVMVPKPLGVLASGGSHLYRDSEGQRVAGAALPLAALDGWLLIEEPVRVVFAPALAVALRIGVVSLLLIIGFSFLAHRLMLNALRPLRALYQGSRRIAAGDLDFALAPVSSPDELALLTRTFNEMTRKLQDHKSSVERGAQSLRAQNDELQRANEVLEQLSITDGLTRLHNHRFFQDHLTREIKRVSRTREPLSMLVCDIDDFKRLNDRQGHKAGDELLVGLARIMNESIRENDFLARYGGEEFVVLAPVTDVDGAVALAEKVRRAVEESSFILGDSKQLTRVTLSIGVAQYKGNRRAFFQAADQALYRAKADGKNCVVPAED